MNNREIMQQAYDAMNDLEGYRPNIDKAMLALHQTLAQPEQEHIECGYDETVGMCTNNPCCEQAQPEQEPVCDKDPFYCWSIRCQVGKVCKNAAQPEQKSISTNDHLCAMLRQVHDVLACTALPMKRPWVGLTGLELNHIFAANVEYPERMCRAIEAKLKEKNCG